MNLFTTCQRFTVAPGDPTTEQLAANAFRAPTSPLNTDQHTGWCDYSDVLSVGFDDLNAWKFNQYAVFSMRVEQKKVPGAILKPLIAEKVREWCAAEHRERCPKSVKEEIRESIETDLLTRILPSRKVYGVCWNTAEGWVTFTGSSVARSDDFRKLFSRTFGLDLTPCDPLDAVENGAELAACGAMDLIAGTIAKSAPVTDPDDLPPCPSHLAAEFMLWLAWRAGENRTIKVGDGETIAHWIDGRLDFRRPDEDGACVTVSDASPVNASALGALSEGRVVRSLPIVIQRGDREFRLTLRGSSLARVGVKLPTLVKGGDLAEQVYESAGLHEEVEFCVGAMFRTFAAQRVGWGTQGADAIRRWLGVEVARVYSFDSAGRGWLFGVTK